MAALQVFSAKKWLVFTLLIVEVTFVISATVPNNLGNENLCKENCDNSELLGDEHAVVKKESASKSNSTEEAKIEEEYFDELIGMLRPGKANQDTENTIEPTNRGARMFGNSQDADASEDNSMKTNNEFTPRTHRRKIWMAALGGIVLKLASLLPLILGKLTIIGMTALLTSKLSLLIVAIIILKGLFSGEKAHSYPEAGFTSPGHQGYQHDYSQAVSGYPAMAASGNHRRWAYYRGVGRELGTWEDALEENKEQ